MGTAESEKEKGVKRKQELVIESHLPLTINISINAEHLTISSTSTDCIIFDQKHQIGGRFDCYKPL